MHNAVVASVFGLLSAINWLGSFAAIFPLLGLLTNANGFLSGGKSDMMVLALLISLPACAASSAYLYKFAGQRLAGLVVAAVPATMGLSLMTM